MSDLVGSDQQQGQAVLPEIPPAAPASAVVMVREKGTTENELMSKLASDPRFKKAGIIEEDLISITLEKTHFLGNAKNQIEQVIEKSAKLIVRYSSEATYEPEDIL